MVKEEMSAKTQSRCVFQRSDFVKCKGSVIARRASRLLQLFRRDLV